MKKYIACVFLIAAAALCLLGCAPENGGADLGDETPGIVIDDPGALSDSLPGIGADVLPAAHLKAGATPGNIINGGYMAAAGGCIYYSNPGDGDRIYKSEPGKPDTRVSSVNAKEINVYGDDIYFKGSGMFGSLYTVKTDGSGERQLYDKRISCLHVYDGNAYFIDDSDGNKVCRYSLSTGGTAALITLPVFYLHIHNGSIYFQRFADGTYNLYKCGLDGEGIQLICVLKENTRAIDFDGGEIFYRACVNVSGKLKYRLYAMGENGTGARLVTANEPYQLAVAGDTVYYANADASNKLYCVKKDGTANIKLSDTATDALFNINGKLYYLGLVAGQGFRLLQL